MREAVVEWPAQERLQAGTFPGREGDLRLVAHGQFLLVVSATKIADDLDPPANIVLHLRKIILVTHRGRTLRQIQGDIGPFEDLQTRVATFNVAAKPEGNRYRKLVVPDPEGLAEQFQETRGIDPVTAPYHAKNVTAEPREAAFGLEQRVEPPGDRHEQPSPKSVPKPSLRSVK
jgi:hypothetical protein